MISVLMLTSIVSCKMVLANTDDSQTKHCTLWKHFVFFPLMCPYIASLPAIYALFLYGSFNWYILLKYEKRLGFISVLFSPPFLYCL